MLTYSLSQAENSVSLEDLVQQILKNRSEGVDDATTRGDLISMGYDTALIDQAFSKADEKKRSWLWPVVIGGGAVVLIGIAAVAGRRR